MSLVSTDVMGTADKIIEYTNQIGGYLVSSNISRPDEVPYATIAVRLPSEKLKSTMVYFRSLGLKVTSEYISGNDVTDQYTDIQARINTLEDTKAKIQNIFNQATKIPDMLNIQQEIINLQSQIDSYKGQAKYLEQTAKYALVSISVSSDEYVLPYQPGQPYRPEIVLKMAVRSLVIQLRAIASVVIWVGVYSVLWLPALLLVLIAYRLYRRRFPPNK